MRRSVNLVHGSSEKPKKLVYDDITRVEVCRKHNLIKVRMGRLNTPFDVNTIHEYSIQVEVLTITAEVPVEGPASGIFQLTIPLNEASAQWLLLNIEVHQGPIHVWNSSGCQSDFCYSPYYVPSPYEVTPGIGKLLQLGGNAAHYNDGYFPVPPPKYEETPNSDLVRKMNTKIPDIGKVVQCPMCGNSTTLSRTIIHLNDACRWTREEIADWLDTLELNLEIQR